MQENNTRLIDEALLDTPVENTFRLTWEFIKLNKNFTFTAMSIFVLLNLFGTLPILSLIFSVFATVFTVVIQMYIGRTFYGTQNIGTYVEGIKASRIDEMLRRHTRAAFGVYVGFILLLIIIVFVLAIIAATTGLINQNMNENDMLMALAGIGLPLIVFFLVISYVQPLVYANIILANSFQEGFKAVFTLFSKDVWSSALQKKYFTYVAKIGIVIMAILFILGILFGLLTMLPALGFLGVIMIFMGLYVLVILMSIMAMMARRIVEVQ